MKRKKAALAVIPVATVIIVFCAGTVFCDEKLPFFKKSNR
jgi:hypothetical protein